MKLKERYKFETAMNCSIDVGSKLIDFSSMNTEFGYSEYEYLKHDTHLSECYDSYMFEIQSNLAVLSISDIILLKNVAKGLVIEVEENIKNVKEIAESFYKYNIDGIFFIDVNVAIRFFDQYFQNQLYYSKLHLSALETLIELNETNDMLKSGQIESGSLKVLPMNKNSVVMYGWFMSKIKKWKFKNPTSLGRYLQGNFLYVNESKRYMNVIGTDVAFAKLKIAFINKPEAYSAFLNEFKSFELDLTDKEKEKISSIKFPLHKDDPHYDGNNW